MAMRDLTVDERDVIDDLADALDSHRDLPEINEWDRVEFEAAINQAQNIVFSRPAKTSGKFVKIESNDDD